MQILTGQEFQTSGVVEIFGQAPPHENSRVLTDVCFVKESQKYPDDFRVGHVLATARHLLPHWNEELAQTLLEDFDLPLCRKVKKLSRGGMTSALGVTVGLASRAPLTLFDEPYLASTRWHGTSSTTGFSPTTPNTRARSCSPHTSSTRSAT